MRMVRMLAATWLTCIICLCLGVSIRADGPTDQAGLVVAVDDEHHIVRAVPLDGGSLTGLELLDRSGLGATDSGGFVCSIASVGCDFPAEACDCAMPLYWGYHHWLDGAWSYSGVGAPGWTLSGGDVDGWTWGSGIALPSVDAAALFDDDRLAPGLPSFVPITDAVGIQLPFAGDANGDASVTLSWRKGDGEAVPSGTLDREGDVFEGVALLPIQPGQWILDLTCVDPDGVNGSALWSQTIQVEGAYTALCPLVLRATSDVP